MEDKKKFDKKEYMREYNQRDYVIEKRNEANKRIRICECGGTYNICHKKNHQFSRIHREYESNL